VGDSSDKNDKTQLLSESQVIEVKPRANLPSGDKNDRSMWKNVVVGADEFAPPAPVKSSARRWLVIGILAVGAIGAGAYFLWPKSSPAVVIIPDAPAAKPATPDSSPPDAAPIPDAAPLDATAIDAGVDAGVPADAGVKPIKRKPPRHTIKRHHPSSAPPR
jgi:hypothetical protein